MTLDAPYRGHALRILATVAIGMAAACLPHGAPRAADPALGAYLSSECVACHLASGVRVGGIPAIVGWPQEQFVAVMKAYRDGHRDNPVMHNVAARLTDEEIAALAAHFGALKPAPQ